MKELHCAVHSFMRTNPRCVAGTSTPRYQNSLPGFTKIIRLYDSTDIDKQNNFSRFLMFGEAAALARVPDAEVRGRDEAPENRHLDAAWA
ncbi:hypothetical protein E2C01_044091 [Portunus trituberculatus]|uniref:Uncharacterized protein n=1 Tax=Portunus trituberculatus TaxID=210409 RepID=A0A5B7FZG5_PORTR|nr:hypothetical protein [Portunus trituberculatus]